MRFVSPVALGLMLATAGMSFGVSVPSAVAKEKEKGPQAPKLKLSKGFLDPIRKVNDALTKKDIEGAKAALPAAEAAMVSNDDRYQYYSLLLNLSIASNDAAMQNDALKGMLATGLVPQGQLGQFNAIVANNELAAKNYDSALAYAEKAKAAGADAGEINPVMAQIVWANAGNDKAQIARGLDLFKQGIDAMKAAGKPVPAQWYQVGVSKAAAADLPQLKDWAKMAFEVDPSGENLRTVLRVFQRNNPTMTNRENLDVMRLMSASGGLALKPDYTEYAEMAFKSGVFGEAKSAIDAGRAKGVLTSGDGADTYTVSSQRIAGDKASLAAAERDAMKSSTGKIAAATADAYLGYGDYAKAVELYKAALEKGSIDAAEVTTRLGIAQLKAGDREGAKATFAKVSGGVRGEIAQYWLAWLNGNSAA